MATPKPQSQRIRISTSAKCAQCSMRVEAGDLVVFMHGDLFHRACWRILVSYGRIEESGELKRQSRELIAEARPSCAVRSRKSSSAVERPAESQ